MHAEARRKGSMVPAQRLLQRAGELAEAIRVRDEAAKKSARAGLTRDQMVAALVARLTSMPGPMQDEIRRALGWGP